LPLALAGRHSQKTLKVVYHGAPSHGALGLHPELTALPRVVFPFIFVVAAEFG